MFDLNQLKIIRVKNCDLPIRSMSITDIEDICDVITMIIYVRPCFGVWSRLIYQLTIPPVLSNQKLCNIYIYMDIYVAQCLDFCQMSQRPDSPHRFPQTAVVLHKYTIQMVICTCKIHVVRRVVLPRRYRPHNICTGI